MNEKSVSQLLVRKKKNLTTFLDISIFRTSLRIKNEKCQVSELLKELNFE